MARPRTPERITQHAPMSGPLAVLILLLASPAAAAQTGCTTDDFETFFNTFGNATSTGETYLDENSIHSFQGPGLVQDGCVYTAAPGGSFQWNGDGYVGLQTRTLTASYNPGNLGTMTLSYDVSQQHVSMDLSAYVGFPDTATVTLYNSQGVIVGSSSYLLPGTGVPEHIVVQRPDIKSIVLEGTNFWSPVLDNHEYCLTAPIFSVALSGTCAQPGAAIVGNYATPGGRVAVAYSFGLGAAPLPGGRCAGTLVGLSNPTLFALPIADANGDYSVLLPSNTPPAVCGSVYVQAIDWTSCSASGVIVV